VSALTWKKSTYSANNGDCVEVAWLKSSFSTNNGECVEVAHMADRLAARDSKNPAGPMLTFPRESFHGLLRRIHAA
jgi:hypothetical protein